jgi:ABC-type sugar transport system substrate-binding protein
MSNKLFKYMVACTLIAAWLLTGCAGPAAVVTPTPAPPTAVPPTAVKQIVIGWSGAPVLDDFQIQLQDGINAKAAELGVKIIHLEHNNDPVKQASDIEDLLSQKVDALLIAAANADAVVPSIDKAVAMGVPVFTIDNASNSDKVISHSGNDTMCVGYRGMEYLADQIGGEGKVLHINGFAGMSLVTWNDDGVKAFLADHPKIQLVMTGYADWDPAKALSITEDNLLTNPDLKGIYVIAEIMTSGPIQALKAQGLTDKIKIMSGGYGPDSQQWLKNGEIIGTMEWSSKAGAGQLLQNMYDYLVNGKQPPKFIGWPVILHTAAGETKPVECPIGNWQP